jgi:hypothetical protein
MKADPTGTPTEQLRARIGWRSLKDHRDAGRCRNCEHQGWADARRPTPRCRYHDISTRQLARCDDWEQRAEQPAQTPEQQLRIYARVAASMHATPQERADAEHAAAALRAQLRRE